MRVSALVGASAAVVVLAACSPSAPASTPSTDGLSGELTIFAAASLQGAFDELADALEAQHSGVTIDPITYDGSSTLATQLAGGASADVFASADEATMAAVDEQGDARVFATNTLEIAVAPGNPLGVSSLADLAALPSSGGKVVLCAAQVPCGSAARSVLEGAGLALTPASEEQSVTAVLTKVQTGDADAGLVYRTDVQAAGDSVQGVPFPEAGSAVNAYPIVALTDSPVARAFVDLVLSDQGQRILADQGFTAP